MFAWLLRTLAARGLVPRVSETELAALEAGDVWVDGELFSGHPDWRRLLAEPYPALRAAEVAFLAGPVERVCAQVDDWELWQRREIPEAIWAFLRREGFFGLTLPVEFGGKGFSQLAASAVYGKLASRSLALSAIVLIPNSVGPGELLLHYGTDAQQRRWLPPLARGEEIPCFALTEPEAGSDAASLSSEGIVFRRDGELHLRLDFEKRYITLAPVATLIGLAFRLRDPEGLLGPTAAPDGDGGITVALVPAATPGVEIGRRHDPMGVPFPNGPIRGRGVVVPLADVIGGPAGVGRGWRMLMETLSGGRAISLPAQAAAGAKTVARAIGAYAGVRRQFGQPIARFEGVAEPLARIAGFAYLLEAARVYTCGAVDAGHRPAVVSAMVKYRATELGRRAVTDAMDVLAGAGLCLGPRNHLARGYMGAPIGITVEGANLLTRTLIVFGQGALRCHPWAGRLLAAVRTGDARGFRRALAGELAHFAANCARAAWTTAGGGRLRRAPVRGPHAPFFRRLGRAAACFAVLADLALLALGPHLKRRGRLSGRFADALSALYLATAALRRFEAEGRPAADFPLLSWSVEWCLAEVDAALRGVLENFPGGLPGALLRGPAAALARLAPLGRPPADRLAEQVAAVLSAPGEARDRLTGGIFLAAGAEDPAARLEEALALSISAQPARRRLARAIQGGAVATSLAGDADLAATAAAAGVLTEEDAALLASAERARRAAIEVDSFSEEAYVRPLHALDAGRAGR